MFTRQRKRTHDVDLPEIAQPEHRKKKLDVSPDSGDEIEKISQDFQVAQLESLKANTQAVSPTVPPVDVITSKPSAQSQMVPAPAEPSSGFPPRPSHSTALPPSLLNSLLSEIVERDIQHQRQRLNEKK